MGVRPAMRYPSAIRCEKRDTRLQNQIPCFTPPESGIVRAIKWSVVSV
jgi:hypothetical protein